MDKFQILEAFHREVLTPMGVNRNIVEDADLIVGARLDKGETKLKFDITEQSTKFPYELRLGRADIFMAYGLVAFISKIDEKTGDWSVQQYTYIDKKAFDGKKGDFLEADALRAVWGGTLNMERDRVALIKDLKMRRLQYVPFRQVEEGAEPNVNMDEAAFIFSRRPILVGDDATDFDVELGKISTELKELIGGNFDAAGTNMNAAAAGAQAEHQMHNHLVLHFIGFRVPGVAAEYKVHRKRTTGK